MLYYILSKFVSEVAMDFKDEAVCNAREAGIELRENEPLAAHTSFRIGGPARWMAFPKTV